MKFVLKTLIIILSLSLFSGQAFALRCGHKLIDIGDGKVKIHLRCGKADFSETRERRVPENCVEDSYYMNDYRYRERYGYRRCRVEIIDVWTYNFGPTKFMRELIFVDGILDEINVMEYGY